VHAVDCRASSRPDEDFVWVSRRWRLRSYGGSQPYPLPLILLLEPRAHLDLGELDDVLAAELGVLTVHLERAITGLGGIGRVHVVRWGDGGAHLHVWFIARPEGLLRTGRRWRSGSTCCLRCRSRSPARTRPGSPRR
jgi:hypothetical protein